MWYKLVSRKWLEKKRKIQKRRDMKTISAWEKYFSDIYDIVDRYNHSQEVNYWKLNATKEVVNSIIEWRDWHNPILEMVYERLWVDKMRYPYVSLYIYNKSYADLWYIYRYRYKKYKNTTIYIVADQRAMPSKMILWYPASINNLIVKWKFDILEQAIDYFCDNVKLDFGYKKWTNFISITNWLCIDEYRRLKKESTTSN